jgi:hypothetical protein
LEGQIGVLDLSNIFERRGFYPPPLKEYQPDRVSPDLLFDQVTNTLFSLVKDLPIVELYLPNHWVFGEQEVHISPMSKGFSAFSPWLHGLGILRS